MPIPVEALRLLSTIPICRALLRVPHVMQFLSDNPEQCQLLVDDAEVFAPFIEQQATMALEERQRVEQHQLALATVAAGPAAVPAPAPAPVLLAPPATLDPNQAVFARSVISIIRDTMKEMLPSRSPDITPTWGGRLVEVLRSPRVPFGVGHITESLSAIHGEMTKDLPELVREIIAGGGVWPHPANRSDAPLLRVPHINVAVVASLWFFAYPPCAEGIRASERTNLIPTVRLHYHPPAP